MFKFKFDLICENPVLTLSNIRAAKVLNELLERPAFTGQLRNQTIEKYVK